MLKFEGYGPPSLVYLRHLINGIMGVTCFESDLILIYIFSRLPFKLLNVVSKERGCMIDVKKLLCEDKMKVRPFEGTLLVRYDPKTLYLYYSITVVHTG